LKIPPFKMIEVYDDDLGRCLFRVGVVSSEDEYEAGIIDGKDRAAWFSELW
jgi:hypothetical protein